MILKLRFNPLYTFVYPYYPCPEHGLHCKTCWSILAWPDDIINMILNHSQQFVSAFDITSLCVKQEKKYFVTIHKNDKILKITEDKINIDGEETILYKCFLNGHLFWSIGEYFLEI